MKTGPRALAVPAAFVAIAAYLASLSWSMQRGSYDIWGGLILFPVLVASTMAVVTGVARRRGDHDMVGLLQLAVVAKIVGGTVLRYAVIYQFYGYGDAQGYDGAGRIIAASLRRGDFSVSLGSGGEGTAAMNLVTGIIYTVIGPTKLGGFLVFSTLAFLGLFLFYRAYRLAFPDGDHRRYALLVFFLPTMLFWPSSIGKEAWMTFTLGIAVYGAARLFAQRPGGFLLLGLGLWLTLVVRPHLAILVFAGLAVGYVMRRSTRRPGRVVPTKVMGVVVLLVLGLFVVSSFRDYFKLDDVGSGSVDQLLQDTSERSTSGGGSDYAPVNVLRSPLQLPNAVVSVLFRPFPFEANSAQTTASSIEGMGLLALFALSWRRLKSGARAFFRNSFVALTVTYSLLFVIAFASIGNFGILARQRTLVYPFAIVLLTIPVARADRSRSPDAVWARASGD